MAIVITGSTKLITLRGDRMGISTKNKALKVFASLAVATSISVSAALPSALAVTQPEADTPLQKDHLQKLSVKGIQKLPNGVKLDLGTNDAYIRVFAKDLVKVSVVKKGEKDPTSRGIAKTNWKTPKFSLKNKGTDLILSTEELNVSIKTKPFGVKFMDKQGNVINEDYMGNGSTSGYEDGKPYVFKKTQEGENFYGFGEQAGLDLNKRGKSLGMWNTDAYSYTKDTKYVYTTIPFFMGLKDKKAYGIFFDNTHRSYYEMASESDDYYYFYANGGSLTYYFAYGPQISDVLDRYTQLTGKMEVPAEWTLGLHQSKWGYTPEEIVNVAKTYRDKKIPLDTMHFDIDYMNEHRVFTWDENYKKALKDLKAMPGFKAIAINDPGVKVDENYDVYKEGTAKDYWAKNADGTPFVGPVWAGDSVFPDFSKKEVRDWWSKKHSVLLNEGIDGMWNDMNEPAVFVDNDTQHHTMPLDAYFGTEDHKIPHTEYHNQYGHDENEATYNAFKVNKPGTRPFVLTRDMYAGSQRWAALWTGDNASTWEHLQMSLPMNMNIGLSGVAFVGNDIGGFAQRPTPEMYARWIEVGAFLPFSRIHYDSDAKAAVKQGQEPWAFGPEIEKISKKYIEMRYQLLPYLYNEFKEAADTGKPVQQPLVYQFQNDEKTYNISDQYMFGDSMMLAPVVKEGQTQRDIYLPRGTKWINYWTGQEYNGGQTISQNVALGDLPIFVKKNSMIPTRDVQQYTDEKPLTNLILDTYLDQKASYTFYEDDGKTYQYKQGKFNQTNLSVLRQGKNVVFTQQKMAKGYESKLKQYTLKLHTVNKPVKVQAGNQKYTAVQTLAENQKKSRSYFYDNKNDILYVNIPVDEQSSVRIK